MGVMAVDLNGFKAGEAAHGNVTRKHRFKYHADQIDVNVNVKSVQADEIAA
jgi:hypothetical protein